MHTSIRNAKIARTFLLLVSLLLIAGGSSLVADERQAFELKLDGGDHVAFELEDLEVGDTRQFFTDEGKEVLVTRTEEGLELEIDGKKIDLGLHGLHSTDDGHVEMVLGEGEHHVRVHAEHDSEGESEEKHVMVWVSGEEDGEEGEESEHSFTFWSDEDDVRARLEESGVLDELDEETRQKILDALEQTRVHKIHSRSKVIVIDAEEGEED